MTKKISQERKEAINKFLKKLNLHQNILSNNLNNLDENYFILDQALTHTSAQKHFNHELLEFLGDAVLRLAATEFIEKDFPEMKVGERSELRAQLVSDKWLSEVGNQIDIKTIFVIGNKASKDNSAIPTLVAEATEALIGAIYSCCKDIDRIHKWLRPYWERTSKNVLNDPHKKNPKSALQEWSQSKGYCLPKYQSNEQSTIHGDPKRFFSQVSVEKEIMGEGIGGSRQEAEKAAARIALEKIKFVKPIK